MSAELIDALAEADYHADPCATPSLSSSIAKVMIDRSPAHAWQAHPKLGATPRAPTATMDRGSLIHRLVLGAGASVARIDADSYRTKAAQAARDEARAAGRIPVLAHDLEAATDAAVAIRENIARQGIDLDGRSEVSCTWQEQAVHGPIWCRSRFDHLVESRATILDIKTTRSAHPNACARQVIDYGYDIQRAAYVRALERARPDLAGRVRFVFIFVETEPPYAAVPAQLDAMLREYGERRWQRAVETWSQCLHTGYWPAYSTEPVRLAAPPWLMARIEEEGAA